LPPEKSHLTKVIHKERNLFGCTIRLNNSLAPLQETHPRKGQQEARGHNANKLGEPCQRKGFNTNVQFSKNVRFNFLHSAIGFIFLDYNCFPVPGALKTNKLELSRKSSSLFVFRTISD